MSQVIVKDDSHSLWGTRAALCEVFDSGFFDLDGVCYAGKTAIAGAAPGLAAARQAGLRPLFMTNNASREPAVVAEHLRELGIAAEADDVLTSAQVITAVVAADHGGAKALIIGADALRSAARQAGLQVVDSADDKPEVVIQGLGNAVDWAALSEGALAIRAGAKFYASNLDSTLPTERGFLLGNGAMVAALTAATGVSPVATGKPSPEIYAVARTRLASAAPIAVGDRLSTDIRGAKAAEVPAMAVLSGVTSARDVLVCEEHDRPNFLGWDVSAIAQAHPLVRLEMGEQAAARIDDEVLVHYQGGQWVLSDGAVLGQRAVSMNEFRASAALAWVLLDAGQVTGEDIPEFVVREPGNGSKEAGDDR